MQVMKRAFISIKQLKGKIVLLFIILFLLSVLTAASISIRQAVINADQNLRSRLPAIATIRQDEAAIQEAHMTGSDVMFEGLHASVIREVGNLPYIQMFDYTAWGHSFFSDELERVFYPDLFLQIGMPAEFIRDFRSLRDEGAPIEQFILKGTQHHSVADIEAGLIDLVDGRTFTEEEIEVGAPVVIVSEGFLVANQLGLGDTFRLNHNVYDERSGSFEPETYYSADNLLGSQSFELEIIGVFEHQLEDGEDLEAWEIEFHLNLLNRIYVPNQLIESTVDHYIEVFAENHPEMIEHLLEAEHLEDIIQYEDIIFLLDDPVYLLNFRQAADEILPPFWIVSDLSNAYGDITSSMEIITDLFDLVMIGSAVATVVVLVLLMLLILRARKQEIGIYLALGEKKERIGFQMLFEVMLISVVAVTLALFVGHGIGNVVSTSMIREDLARQAEEERFLNVEFGSPEALGFRFEMTHEEMLEAYDVSLSVHTVLIFYSVALGTVLISTVIPVVYIMKLNPKDILMKSGIG